MKAIIPNFKAKSLFEIDLNFYKELDIKYLFCDLDNTLDLYTQKIPSEHVINFVKELNKNNINLIICSNNNKKRVMKYAKILKVDFIYNSFKPFTFKTKKFIKKMNIDISKSLFVGDQLLTDIKCGNRLGMKTLYVDEIAHKNGFFTKINKKIELIYKKRLENSIFCKDWRDIYVNSQES